MASDLSRVDQNLQAIKAIEGSWDLPAVPDEAKIDLAGNTTMTPSSINTLFSGLAGDIEAAGKPDPLPTRADFGVEAEPVEPSYGYKPDPSMSTEVGRQIAGITGIPQPQAYDTSAPQKLKQRLADEGYLDLSPEEIQSDRWLPEYSYAARELNFDDMSRRFSGEKPGSFSVDQIMGVVDEWLTPRGLYRAAVELDLWWDAGNIKEEFQEWDDKLATWREDPWDPRKLVDLVTGPLDDLLFPALNIALMFTGIGEVIAVGRGLHGGVKGAQALAGIYRGGKGMAFMQAQGIGSRFSAADDIARFSRPSFLGSKVGKEGAGPARQATAQVMNQWRRQSSVIMAKKVNQQALRAGFSSNVQQLIDADRGGQSLDRFGAGDRVYDAFTNPMFDWGADLLFMPPNIFKVGAFAEPAKAALQSVKGGFLKASDNQHLLTAWDKPVQSYLSELTPESAGKVFDNLGVSSGEEALKAYRKRLRQSGLKRALSDTFFEGDDEMMGAALSYAATMGAVEHYARRSASLLDGGPLHELSSGARTAFHQTRNQTVARLRHLDENNVDSLIEHIAKYGDDPAEMATKGSRRADKFQENLRKTREQYLEPAEEAAARQGRIADGHTRFVGRKNPDTGQYEWRPLAAGDEIDNDLFFVDVHKDELRTALGADADDVLAGRTSLDDRFTNRYLHRDQDGMLRHYRLSEADKVRLYSQEGLENLRGIARHHNDLRSQFMVEIMDDMTPEALEQYVYEVLPTFGRMGEFTEASGEILDAIRRGDLNNVQFVSPMSPGNRRVAALPWTPGSDKWTDEMFSMMLELPNDEKLAGSLMDSVFAPFARDVDPTMGTFTAAATDTVTKQEALAFAATAMRPVKMMKALRKLQALDKGQDFLQVTSRHLDEVQEITKPGLREVLAEAFGQHAVTETRLTELTDLAKMADEAGVGLDEIERVLRDKIAEIDGMAKWSERYMVPTQLNRTDDIAKEVEAKVKELHKQAYFMASEVQGQPQWLTDFLASRGYKLTYGVDFAQPLELDGIMPAFADVSRRHLRQKRLGQFFSRQEPTWISALKQRKIREGVHAKLSQVTDVEEGRRLNLGQYPEAAGGNADQDQVLNDLFDILREVQDEAQHKLNTLASGARFTEKIGTRASLSRIPFSLDRLASDLKFEDFVSRVLKRGYNRSQAIAMYRGIQSSQALGVRAHGLYAIESKLRSEPNLTGGLRLLGATNAGDKFRRGRAVLGIVPGAYAGNVAATELAGQEPGSGGQMLAGAIGGLAGGALGGSRAGIPGVRALAEGLESGAIGTGRALNWSYLADNVVNVRDLVRFSLSPIFDASRYSEAIILAQIGEMPTALRNMSVNQSPSGFRRMLAREFRDGGASSDAAREAAKREWEKVQAGFATQSDNWGDFDWEVIDGVGRRFSSVGILGFSPVDWMTSTFGHLTRHGVDAKKAYGTVRDIYTYGTTGRSAAELSMNFVFFPFSFTKKVTSHLSKFMADDLSRLVVLHDMMATYQTLDEHFDLNEEWRDRLPVLQKAHRLNLLAYGIGLGQFGGVNAPILEGVSGAIQQIPGMEDLDKTMPGPAAITNMFIPQMVPMNSGDEANEVWDTVRGMMPVINDVNSLIGMMVEQGHVIASEEHITKQAEQRRAWDEWRDFQEDIKPALEQAGVSWNQAVRNSEIGYLISNERTRISQKYPSWKTGMGDGIAHSTAIDMELKERIQYPKENADVLLTDYQGLIDQTEQAMGMTFDGSPENVPPEFFDLFRRLAIDYAKEDPAFLRLYNRFYRRSLGDITSDI